MQKFRFTVRLQSRHFYEGFNYAFIKEKFVTRPNDVHTRGQVNYSEKNNSLEQFKFQQIFKLFVLTRLKCDQTFSICTCS